MTHMIIDGLLVICLIVSEISARINKNHYIEMRYDYDALYADYVCLERAASQLYNQIEFLTKTSGTMRVVDFKLFVQTEMFGLSQELGIVPDVMEE